MRFLLKILMKLVTMVVMVVLIAGVMRYAKPYIMKAAGIKDTPGSIGTPQFTQEESSFMKAILDSGLRLISGKAKKGELASDLSDKLYEGTASKKEMKELGIELVKSDGSPAEPKEGAAGAGASARPGAAGSQAGGSPLAAAAAPARAAKPKPSLVPFADSELSASVVFARLRERAKTSSVELMVVPIVLLGWIFWEMRRRKKARMDDLMPAFAHVAMPSDSEPFEPKHAVQSLGAEDFEMLIALIYQRQGFRISMPEALSGGRGGDFLLLRKAERVLVQCKKFNREHRIPVEKVRELHEAMTLFNATSGMYVASCGYSWDARNYANRHQMTVINARTLDQLITAAQETPEENLLAVSQWAPKFMTKVQLTPPVCPSCEAPMEHINRSAAVWVCSQRPDCKGRREARKHQKPGVGQGANTASAMSRAGS